MTFLTPWTIALVGALTVPPLVLLYFLKLKRKEVPISSTFFWKRAVQDLQVNAPFQRLRKNLLLLLQLLVLALAALALGQPLLKQRENLKRSLIVLIDRSASMNVVETDGRTRLQRAKDEAVKLVEQMGAATQKDQQEVDRIMVLTFSDRAQIVEPFSNNKNELTRAIQSITPSDGLSRLQEAISLAEAHAQVKVLVNPDEEDPTKSTTVATSTISKLVLFSDGQIQDAENVTLKNMNMELVNVADADDNVGIVSLSASRNYRRPELLNVVARVRNFGPQPVDVELDLFADGEHVDVQADDLTLGPDGDATPNPGADAATSVRVVAFDELAMDRGGIIEVRLSRRDALAADDRVLAVVAPPKALSILLVTLGNLWLDRAVRSLPVQLTRMTPQEYEKADDEDITEGGHSRFDVVIFDDCTSSRLPKGNYLFFGQVPALDGFALGEAAGFDSILDWNETHPVMRHVTPGNVDIWSWRPMQLPETAVPLMRASGGVVLHAVNHEGNRYLICSFALLDETRSASNSTWHLRPHFVIFLTNAVRHLSGTLAGEVEARLRPGDPIEIRVPRGQDKVEIQRPDGTSDQILTGGLETAHYANTDRIGVYQVAPTTAGENRFAVNLFSDAESRIRPNSQLVIGGDAVAARKEVQVSNVPAWPWLLIAMLAFLMLEWAVYSKRILV